MLKGFDIKKYLSKKPKSDNSFDTVQELKELNKIPINKKFIKDNDDVEGIFKKTAEQNNIKDYDKSIAAQAVESSAPIILKLKKYFNRSRPKVAAKKNNIKMQGVELDSMKTASYPSGHSVQGILIANLLADKYPKAKAAFLKTGDNISKSRRVASPLFKSDSKLGEEIGRDMYEYIKKGRR
jgi:hypothetical protein